MRKISYFKHMMCIQGLLILLVVWGLPATALAQDQELIAQRQALWEKYRWPQSYETNYKKTAAYGRSVGVQVYALNENWDLIQVMIYLGAYQPGYIYLLYERKTESASLINLPFYTTSQQIYSQTEVAGLAEFDLVTKQLRIFSKYRGVGGCGRYGIWRIDEAKVVLLQMRELGCQAADLLGDKMPLNPLAFPQIWPE